VFVFDSENNYTKVWERFGSEFNSNDGYTLPEDSIGYPGTGVWESIDLSRWAGQTIFVMFEGASSWGPAWYFDDFSVQYQDTSINSFLRRRPSLRPPSLRNIGRFHTPGKLQISMPGGAATAMLMELVVPEALFVHLEALPRADKSPSPPNS
jgi:hypothetical protein